jgi:1-acyl-sn-glycerol-3-phosphate acyltransferase
MDPSGSSEQSTDRARPDDSRAQVIRRRSISISLVTAFAFGSLLLAPLVLPALLVIDLLRLKPRLPLVRLFAFGICWAWLEVVGVLAATGLWLTGRAGELSAHYRLQTWWADKIMGALRVTCGLRPDVEGVGALLPGPTILFVRHASLADSLLTAWVITDAVGMRPRVVMKRELLVDPCLDIVGNRLPNCFVDRSAADTGPELAAIGAMSQGLGSGDVAVLFPEGTRANPIKQQRAVTRIGRTDPVRAERMTKLTNLLPPRPGGAATMLGAVPDAALCVGWHVGFEGLDTFSGIVAALGRRRTPVRIRFEEIPRPSSAAISHGGPDTGPPAEFTEWLDGVWLDLDRRVCELLETPPGS